jgi:hypothetical protein
MSKRVPLANGKFGEERPVVANAEVGRKSPETVIDCLSPNDGLLTILDLSAGPIECQVSQYTGSASNWINVAGQSKSNMPGLKLASLIVLFAVVCCRDTTGSVSFEAEASKPHSLDELLILHEAAVSSDGRDFYFVEPIGRFGKAGVLAAIDYIQGKGKKGFSNHDLSLFLGVVVHAKLHTGYEFCSDKSMRRRLEVVGARPAAHRSRWSNFKTGVDDFCQGSFPFLRR